MWTDERLRLELKEATEAVGSTSSNALTLNGYQKVVRAVRYKYGTWNAGLVTLGYEVAMATPKTDWTKDDVREFALKAIADGVKPTRLSLGKHIQGFDAAVDNFFGSYREFTEYAGYCKVIKQYAPVKRYIPSYKTVEGIQREITRLWYIGAPLNYKYIKKRRSNILVATNLHIGSWRQAVESVGINYADITKSSDMNILSECGTEFELLFAEILTELNYEYIREGERLDEIFPDGFTLKPDFILPNWRWIDCKLSEWTDVSEMLKRYAPLEPNGISVVYLRGSKRRLERGRKWRYEHVSVYCFTEDLPEVRRKYYDDKLNEIARKAEVGAVAK